MKLEVSDKVAVKMKRPYTKKGYYKARLNEIKPKKTESKFGYKLVLLFSILDEAYKEENGEYLTLAFETYYKYKNEDGTYNTALTPNSNSTKVFKNLGWEFSENGIETDNLIGAEAEVLVKDYNYEYTDQAGVKSTELASSIGEINPWKD